MAFPCATQNEINADDAQTLVANGCTYVIEGANMPSTHDAVEIFHDARIMYAPGKAANAGGVAVSGLEMSQNSTRIPWPPEQVNSKLQEIMVNIHQTCQKYGKEEKGYINYLKGANIGGFIKIANAMVSLGIV